MDIKLYSLRETSNPDLFRYCNYDGDWEYYWQKSTNVFKPAVSRILRYGIAKGDRYNQYLLNSNKEDAEKKFKEAGEQGSRVHTAIEMLVKGSTLSMATLLPNTLTGKPEKLTFREWQAILSFMAFVEKYNPRLILVEQSVSGKDYAGTIDIICAIDMQETIETTEEIDGKQKKTKACITKSYKYLLDFKTSADVYDEYKAQTAAYFYADHGIENLDGTGILRLGTRHQNGPIKNAGYELVLWDKEQTKRHYAGFRAAKNLHDMIAPKFEMNNDSVPFEVKYKMPNYVSSAPVQGEATNEAIETA